MNKINKSIIVILATTALFGCEQKPESVIRNQQEIIYNLSNPQKVGELADGRSVNRAVVPYLCATCNNSDDHFVYFVGEVVTDNYSVQVGKTRQTRVNVTLPSNATNEQILAAAKEIEIQTQKEEEAEYNRLKEKFGK